MLHSNPLFRCYFGDAKDTLNPQEYLALSQEQDILTYMPFTQLKKNMLLQKAVFLKQIHSAHGLSLTDATSAAHVRSFDHEGDFLVTNQPAVGLGVMSADCLPIIMVDLTRNAIGIAHAGWRGSVAGIAERMLQTLYNRFNSEPQHIKIFFGPCAKICCYQVQPSFIESFSEIPQAASFFIEKNNSYYFDIALYNRTILMQAGVPDTAFCLEYNQCTICNDSFYSHRRGDTNRQMTVVTLI